MIRSILLQSLWAFPLLFCISCKNDPKTTDNNTTDSTSEITVVETPAFEIKNLKKTIGDCATENNCLEVIVDYPFLNGVKPAIQDRINGAIAQEIIASLDMGDTTGTITIGQAILEWANVFQEYLSEDPGERVVFTYQCEGKGRIYENYAITELPASTYTGGAHPNYYIYLSTYNLTTGDVIELEDIIVDNKAFNTIVEKAFYDFIEADGERPIEKENYFWDKGFYLPANFAITEKGLQFIYNPYEITAYALGSFDFMVPYADLEGIIDLPK